MALYKLNTVLPSAKIVEPNGFGKSHIRYIPVTAINRGSDGSLRCSTWLDFRTDCFGEYKFFSDDPFEEDCVGEEGIFCDWLIPEMERSTLLTTSHTFVEDPSWIDINPTFDFHVSTKKPKGVDYIQIFESSRGVYGVKRNAEGLIYCDDEQRYVPYSRLKLHRGDCNKFYLWE